MHAFKIESLSRRAAPAPGLTTRRPATSPLSRTEMRRIVAELLG